MAGQQIGYIKDQERYWDLIHRTRDEQSGAGLAHRLGGVKPSFAGSSSVGARAASAGLGGQGAGMDSKRRRVGAGSSPAMSAAGGRLAPPGRAMLASETVNALPPPAEASASPYLTGKQGGPGSNPLQEYASRTVAAATDGRAVAPDQMGPTLTANAGPRAAVSTTMAPDAGVQATATERAKQLPAQRAYTASEQQAAAVADTAAPVGAAVAEGAAGLAPGTASDAPILRRPSGGGQNPRKRRLFLPDD